LVEEGQAEGVIAMTKVAIVTGTAHGIGGAIAGALTEQGIVVHGIDKDVVDVTDSAAVNAFVDKVGPVDILVNCAGGVCGQVRHPVEQISDADWSAILDANLTGTFNCTRAVVPAMKTRGWGRIVNISSGSGRGADRVLGIQAYSSAKAGQIGFTRQMAWELGGFGITVNCICPGFILSNPTSIKQWEDMGQAGQAQYIKETAVGRTGEPADIAAGVLFFVSTTASWITGQTISIDGGHSIF
jgi:3-oxoacyl-[acyl-carrier protein] reductase